MTSAYEAATTTTNNNNNNNAVEDDDDDNVIDLGHCRRPPELHIAPMLDFSKREFRKLFSILSKKLVLWTDMVVDETIAHSIRLEDLLEADDLENKQVCQIGGNSPELCGQATYIVDTVYGYDECNLNVDCPSNRVVGEREFGAVLMKQVDVAYSVLERMQQQASDRRMPISVKCRVGVDDWDDLEWLAEFVHRLSPVCRRFYLHARKCVLNGLYSARQNRSIPPLQFPRVYELCRRFPHVEFWINGGIRNLTDAKRICYGSELPEHAPERHIELPCARCQLPHGSCMVPPYKRAPPNFRGCMMGRAAIDNPAIFWDVDRYFYGLDKNPCQNRRQVLNEYCAYLEKLYPRRCCDLEPQATYRLPIPDVEHLCPWCPVCRDVYAQSSDDDNHDNCDVYPPALAGNREIVKVSARLVGRVFKPVRGLFHGLPKGKVFLHACDKLSRDTTLRNCGPGFILRRVMQEVPDELLDRDFVKSEDLD